MTNVAFEGNDCPSGKDWLTSHPANDPISQKAAVLFAALLEKMHEHHASRLVIAVSGGSGVGKSSTANLFRDYLEDIGIECALIGGDEYPYRTPVQNDAERLRILRQAGVKGMLQQGVWSTDAWHELKELQDAMVDADPKYDAVYPWHKVYLDYGRKALATYLGSEAEQDYADMQQLIDAFHRGETKIPLRKLGDGEADFHYEVGDFSHKQVLLIEWTHAGNPTLKGIDINLFLYSSPEETLERRKRRGRNANTDTPLIALVLELEQIMLNENAKHADMIQLMDGELLTAKTYQERVGKK